MARSTTGAAPPQLWWESLTDDIEDPITLEPINTLSYPPFILRKQASSTAAGNSASNNENRNDALYHFDGLALASYIVSRGIFQNPLTRESLTWDDCRRLDQYLDAYDYAYTTGSDSNQQQKTESHSQIHSGRHTKRRFQVLEAFALRESVQVRNRPMPTAAHGSRNQQIEEARRQRADVLRSEATAALSGLFVYGTTNNRSGSNTSSRDHRGRQTRQQQQQAVASSNTVRSNTTQNTELEPNLTFGFNLHVRDTDIIDSKDDNDDGYGMVVIDDDDQVRVESEDHAYQQLQEAFPHLLSPVETPQDKPSNYLGLSVNDEEAKRSLERIKRQAALDRQHEWVRQQALRYARQQLEEEVRQRKLEREQEREATKAKAKATLQQQQQEQEEIDRARAEIKQWCTSQWEQMREVNDQRQVREQERLRAEEKEKARKHQLEDKQKAQEEKQQMEEKEQQEALDKEAKQKAAKAAKRKRAKDRKKVQKAQEAIDQEKREKEAALEAKKEASANKCDACAGGIVGFAFEKFGHQFCSSKCARAGPSAST